LALSASHWQSILAKGIETLDQAWTLKMMGFELGQGFHLGRPTARRDFLAYVDGGERSDARGLVSH